MAHLARYSFSIRVVPLRYRNGRSSRSTRLLPVLVLVLALAPSAVALGDTPERDSPYSTRAPADDQYATPSASGGTAPAGTQGGGVSGTGSSGSPTSEPDTGNAGSGDPDPVSRVDGDRDRPQQVTAPSEPRVVADAGGELPFTGSTVGILLLVALLLLGVGGVLRAGQRRLPAH